MTNTTTFLRTIAVATAIVSGATAVQAAEHVLLTVTAGGSETTYTLDDLRAMPVTSFETTTIWTEGAQDFTGVSLQDLLAALEISEGTISATAINDYSVEIPVSDAIEGGPIIAYENNGAEMSRRGKGPLWVVYPYDDNSDYQTETYFSRSIWQLDRLSVD